MKAEKTSHSQLSKNFAPSRLRVRHSQLTTRNSRLATSQKLRASVALCEVLLQTRDTPLHVSAVLCFFHTEARRHGGSQRRIQKSFVSFVFFVVMYCYQPKTSNCNPARCGFYHEIHERHERESSNMDGQDGQDSWKELILLILTIHVIKLSREGAKTRSF